VLCFDSTTRYLLIFDIVITHNRDEPLKEDSVNREVVVIIKVVVYGRLSMYVEALYFVELDAFLLHAIFPRETFYIN